MESLVCVIRTDSCDHIVERWLFFTGVLLDYSDRIWRGNMLNEIISGPKVLTRFRERSLLITSKIKHNTDIVNKLGWLVWVNLSVLSSPIFLMASISNSSTYSRICSCWIQLTASLAITWMLPHLTLKLIKRTYIQNFPGWSERQKINPFMKWFNIPNWFWWMAFRVITRYKQIMCFS